jgi:hypothetical protein
MAVSFFSGLVTLKTATSSSFSSCSELQLVAKNKAHKLVIISSLFMINVAKKQFEIII